ncbi:MAG: ABC-F family ATP-binding cassette domain-containing protein, partial [Sphaerochaetaceae bacterium]
TGQIPPDTGTIAMKNDTDLVMLEQEVRFKEITTVSSYLFQGNGMRISTWNAYHTAIAYPDDQNNLQHQTELMESLDGWNLQTDYQSLLGELGLYDILEATMDTLSGGMQKKVAIARVLAARSTMLLLDEPTNHLDIETIEWLESYLKTCSATIIMVTHDRYFLDNVCSTILELDGGQIYIHPGTFADYLARREQRIEHLQKEQDRLKTVLRRELEWLKHSPKARTGKDSGRKDRIEIMLANQHIVGDQEQKTFQSINRRLGKKILEATHLSKSFNGNPVIRDFSYSFTKGKKIGVVGSNGSGKTTLLDLLCGHLQSDSGTLEIGINTVFAYYDQTSRNLESEKTILEFVEDIATQVVLGPSQVVSAAKFLELFGFPTSMHRGSIANLSGGEKRRLYLVSRLLSNPNFLLLDEPTNDLDLPTMENLEQYIQDFGGCVLIVSHDRAFLDLTCDELFVIEAGGIVYYEAQRYSDWREKGLGISSSKQRDFSRNPIPDLTRKSKQKGLTYRERQELETLEGQMETLTAQIMELEASFSYAESTELGTLAERTQTYHNLRAELDGTEERWLELVEKS